MPRVAVCPQCECESIVPDEMETAEWAKCPQCHEFMEMSKAIGRRLPAAIPIDQSQNDASRPSTMVSDIASVDTWQSEKLEAAPPEADELSADTILFDPPATETPEEAAQRIDAWFRSAKTVAEGDPISAEDVNVEPIGFEAGSDDVSRDEFGDRATNATIEIGSVGFDSGDEDADFEIEAPADIAPDSAAWDDTQHMERLLANIESEPAAEFVPSDESASAVGEEEKHEGNFKAWSTASSLVNKGNGRRRRSLIRTLTGTVIGGVFGLAIAYYALLWVRGPEIDFLQVAQYLPKAVLPASFKQETRQLAAAQPSLPAIEQSVPATNDEPANNAIDPASTDDQSIATAAATTENAGEQVAATDQTKATTEADATQTSFNEPADPTETEKPSDNRYGEKSTATPATSNEPAPLDDPAATPIATDTTANPAAVTVELANAPSFTADDLRAALTAASAAKPKLMEGNFTDSLETGRAKGFAYSMLADLAQKVTFVAPSGDGASDLQKQANDLFRSTLSDLHTRGEVAQIVLKWIASPSRKHGGVFFAGNVAGQDDKGSVTECSVDLGSGQSLTALVPPALANQIGSASQPVGIVGSIVDRPADQIGGYTGGATQAIFVSRLVSLQ